tara:strand:- start:3238 stop:4605 length:1368 start_codon:yes stop_codon:yes gene_type:complete
MNMTKKRYGVEHARRNIKKLTSQPTRIDEDSIRSVARYFVANAHNSLACMGMCILLSGRSLQLLLSDTVHLRLDPTGNGLLGSTWLFQSTVVPLGWRDSFHHSSKNAFIIIPAPFARQLEEIRDSRPAFAEIEKGLKQLLSELSPPHEKITLRRLENVIRFEGKRFDLNSFEMDFIQSTDKDVHMQHYYVNFQTKSIREKHAKYVAWICQTPEKVGLLEVSGRFGSKWALNAKGVKKAFSFITEQLEDSIEFNRPQALFTWYSAYILQLLQLLTLHRPCESPFKKLDRFTDDYEYLQITDKGPSSTRIIPLGKLGKTVVSEYVQFLTLLASKIALRSPEIAEGIQAILRSKKPLFHSWRGKDFSPVTESYLKNLFRDDLPLPLNWHRHTLATELVNRGVCRHKIAAYMGHHRPLEHSFSRFSCASFEWLYEVRDEIEMVVHEFSVPLIRVNQVFQ